MPGDLYATMITRKVVHGRMEEYKRTRQDIVKEW
jgi:hypothetical protein